MSLHPPQRRSQARRLKIHPKGGRSAATISDISCSPSYHDSEAGWDGGVVEGLGIEILCFPALVGGLLHDFKSTMEEYLSCYTISVPNTSILHKG